MNDFREYSAAFNDHQNDLAHYGIKGMKWRHHKLRVGGVPGLVGNLLRNRRRNGSDDEEQQPASRGSYYDSDRVNKDRGSISNSNRRSSVADSNRRGRYADSERAAAERDAHSKEVERNRNGLKTLGRMIKTNTQIALEKAAYERNKPAMTAASNAEKERQTKLAQEKAEKERRRRRRQYLNNMKADKESRRAGRH